ncbi:activating signal cointegrator 1 complex subunit 1 isoform X2 [Pararge aegeria]|uniref:activating signal cointegrator 1 complex subunit 1 isoform X2 n=1 Tax=Pararge aegeria TaxID=116150 RepID=UPI0019D2A722|nr:activating signal cointegrator 1 complex subunit 1 isoform X2 [Pararge aegeria]
MNILKPELLWIEQRCYRLNDLITDVSALQEHDLYENAPNNEFEEDDLDDVDCKIDQVDDSRFSTSIHVSKHYMGHIIGKRGCTIARISRDTKTDIKTPRPGQNKDITIMGQNVSSVKAAVRRINLVVMASRVKQAYTHFVSIPMNSPDIVKNFESFKENVLQQCPGIEDSLFIKPGKLHITVGVMCLMDNEERLMATKLLTDARDKYIMPMLQDYLPFNIRIKGLSYMNDDPKAINVLYGCIEEDGAPFGLMQKMVDAVYRHFNKAGLMNEKFYRDNVKMHVTLLNSKYRSQQKEIEESETSSENTRARKEPFDGSEILSKFANYDFGVVEFNNIHLSQRSTVGSDGYYQPSFVISCVSTN